MAILNSEAEASAFADALERSELRITSPIAIFEATLGLCRIRHATVEEAAGPEPDEGRAGRGKTLRVAIGYRHAIADEAVALLIVLEQ